MSRKDESKAKDAIVTVNIDDFTRTRDSVIVSLAALQSAVSDLSRAYINHANTVLNRGPVSFEAGLGSGLAGGFASSLLENGLLGGTVAQHVAAQESKIDAGEKKKRKRAPHDPNAPKRALTPYFLYMQHNRAQIANELGPDAKPKEVADEGTRRWSTMTEGEKEIWKKLYSDNLAVYKAKMKAYKAGLPVPDDNAQADDQLQQSVAAAEAEADEDDDDEEDEDEDEDEDEEEELAKEPTPPPSQKRRRGASGAKIPTSPVSAKKASPEKKKAQAVSAKKDAPAIARPSTSSGKSASKKKRKSQGGADE